MICPNCGFANVVGDDFCGSCGTFLPWETSAAGTPGATEGTTVHPGAAAVPGERVTCENCGASNPIGRTFCQSCGWRHDAGAAPAVVPVPPAPSPRRLSPTVIAGALLALLATIGVIALVVFSSRNPSPTGSVPAGSTASATPSSLAVASGTPSPSLTSPAAASPTGSTLEPTGSPLETPEDTTSPPTQEPTPEPTAPPTPEPTPVTNDLTVTRFTASPPTVVQGESVRLSATIKNLGNGIAGQSTTEFRYEPGNVIVRIDTGRIGPSLVRVIAYDLDTGDLAPGTYRIRVVADRLRKVRETNEDNNTMTVEIIVQAPPPPTEPPPTEPPPTESAPPP